MSFFKIGKKLEKKATVQVGSYNGILSNFLPEVREKCGQELAASKKLYGQIYERRKAKLTNDTMFFPEINRVKKELEELDAEYQANKEMIDGIVLRSSHPISNQDIVRLTELMKPIVEAQVAKSYLDSLNQSYLEIQKDS